MRTNFYDVTFSEFETLMAGSGGSGPGLLQLYGLFYKKKLTAFPELCPDRLAPRAYIAFKERFYLKSPEIEQVQSSSDDTHKFLIKFEDGKSVETVLIPFYGRYTICISTQVGCAMKCSFCYTGTQGLTRHLTASEIVAQYLIAWRWIESRHEWGKIAPRIVFMGQGEPLHNVDNLKKAFDIFMAPQGLHLGPRQMTLSTSGYMPGILRLGELPQFNLALSLHSPFNHKREELIPINKTWPVEEIMAELKKRPLKGRQFLTMEYLLVKDFNDSEEDAIALRDLLFGLKAIVNIIPFNPYPGAKWERPTEEGVIAFKKRLVELKVIAMVRVTKGADILAACGQLNTKEESLPLN
jgi:23S rRNA (adenine2503-C2)-methyltransferase